MFISHILSFKNGRSCRTQPKKFIGALLLLVLAVAGCSKPATPKRESKRKSVIKKPGAVQQQKIKYGNPRELLKDINFWAYQIQDQNENDNMGKLAVSRYDLLVIDQACSLKGEEGYDSKADVKRLKRSPGSSPHKRKLVVCYLNVGEAESYRWYWKRGWRVGNPPWIVARDPDGWDENYPVRFWDPEWKDTMKKRLGRIVDDEYDGVYLDWLEVYSFQEVANVAQSEGFDARVELTNFITELADYAHAKNPDFLFIAQNAAELETFSEYTKLFDAIAQEAIWFDGAGDPDKDEFLGDEQVDQDESEKLVEFLKSWQKQGKVVLNVEYAEESSNVNAAYRMGQENGFKTYVTLRQLDKLTSTPPGGYPETKGTREKEGV